DFFQNDTLRPCTATGGKGDDILIGGFANDVLKGNAGNDLLTGWSGVNRLEGGAGADFLLAGVGIDRMLDLADEDWMIAFTLSEWSPEPFGDASLGTMDVGDVDYNEFYVDDATFTDGVMQLLAGAFYGTDEYAGPEGWDLIEGIPFNPVDTYLPWG